MKVQGFTVRNVAWLIVLAAVLLLAVLNARETVDIIGKLIGLLMPLILGICMAFVLNVLMRFIENRIFAGIGKGAGRGARVWQALRRPVSLLLTLLIVAGIVTFVVLLIIPSIQEALATFMDKAPEFIRQVVEWGNNLLVDLGLSENIDELQQINRVDIMKNVLAFLSGSDSIAATSIFSAAAHVFSSIANAFFGFIFALYILVSKERLRCQGGKLLRAWLPDRAATIASRILKRASKIFSKFVSGQCIEAVIIGTLTGLGALAINPHYAVMLGVLVGFLALIPIIGAFIGVVVGALILFMESPWQALAFIIFILVLQQIEGNLIYPRVVGKSIGLPGMWVLFAVLVGGGVGGIFGIVIGVPLSALIYSLLREATETRLQRKRLKSVVSAPRSDS